LGAFELCNKAAKEIGEVAAVRRDTKRMPGLIHFVGHGAYWEPKVVGNLIVSDRNVYIY